jgi:hypothetical protein
MLIGTQFTAAYAQSAQWTYTSSMTSSDGIQVTNVKHSNNLIINRATLPYISVLYTLPDPDHTVWDHPGTVFATGHALEKHNFGGGQYEHAEYYIPCLPADWPENGCYRYEQFYYFFDSSGSVKPKFRSILLIWGPGFSGSEGTPQYSVFWRVDTDILGSSSDKFERYTTSWTANPINSEASFTDATPHGEDNTEWRTYDTVEGSGKRLGIEPLPDDAGKIWIVRYKTDIFGNTIELDPAPTNTPDAYLTGESVSGQNDVFWYRAFRVASTSCITTNPCVVGMTTHVTGM